jgi:hypothetical protein
MNVLIARLPSCALLTLAWSFLVGPALAAPAAAAPFAPAPAVATAVAAAPPALPALLGPPALCHPIDIGDAHSLPWKGQEAWGRLADYDLARVVEDTRAVLRGTPDTLVHMETARRAVIYLSGIGGGDKRETKQGDAHDAAWRAREIARLVGALKADIVDAQLDDGNDAEAARRLGLAWFDAGYVLCVLEQSGQRAPAAGYENGLALLEQAAALLPNDGGLCLGLSIAHFGGGRPGKACSVYLDKVVAAADDPDGLLRRNLLGTMGMFLGTKTYDELAAKVRSTLERA